MNTPGPDGTPLPEYTFDRDHTPIDDEIVEIKHPDGKMSRSRPLRAKPSPALAPEPFEEARYVVQMLPQGEFGFEVDGIFFAAATPQDAFAQFLKTRAGARAKGRKVTIRPCELVKVPEAAPPKKSEKP